jgi:hypothetical protein
VIDKSLYDFDDNFITPDIKLLRKNPSFIEKNVFLDLFFKLL